MIDIKTFTFDPVYDDFANTIAMDLLMFVQNAKRSTRTIKKTFEYFEPLEFTLTIKMKTVETFNPLKTKTFRYLPWEILNYNNRGFAIDSNSYIPTDSSPDIEIIVYVDQSINPQGYLNLYFKLIDDVRHELEHLLQKGINQIPGHTCHTPVQARESSDPYHYFLLDEEIPAMVAGMRASSIKRGIPIDEEFTNYLMPFIEFSLITDAQYLTIMNAWLNFAAELYPNLKISEKFMKTIKTG